MKSKNMDARVYIWNALGGFINASFSVVIMMVLTHTSGTYTAGIFSLGYANAMLFTNIGTLDARSYQCADTSGKICFSDYFSFRTVTCGIMLLLSVVFVTALDYSKEKAICTLLLCLYCAISNISDIYQGNSQLIGRLDLGGQSLALRCLVSMGIFTVIFISTGDLIWSLICMNMAAFVWVMTYDRLVIGRFERPKLHITRSAAAELLKAVLPLGICMTVQVGIFNMPKYAIDAYMTAEEQTIYNIIFMPTFVTSLFGSMIYRPVLVHMSILWKERALNKFFELLIKKISLMAGFAVLSVVAGYLLGTWFLSTLYGVNIYPYKMELSVLIIGGGFTGIVNLLYFVVTVMNRQKWMLLAYVAVFVISGVISFGLVSSKALLGAAISFLITSVLLNILLLAIILLGVKCRSSNYGSSEMC